MLKWIARHTIAKAEKRIGVKLDYARKIAETDIGLLMRYSKIFGFLDKNNKVPTEAYHIARLRGAISADCGSCVEAEINIAKAAGVSSEIVTAVLSADYSSLSDTLKAVAILSDAVTGQQSDAPEAREQIVSSYGEAGLIELSFAMNGAALLPGIKRTMGFATVCDLNVVRKLV